MMQLATLFPNANLQTGEHKALLPGRPADPLQTQPAREPNKRFRCNNTRGGGLEVGWPEVAWYLGPNLASTDQHCRSGALTLSTPSLPRLRDREAVAGAICGSEGSGRQLCFISFPALPSGARSGRRSAWRVRRTASPWSSGWACWPNRRRARRRINW